VSEKKRPCPASVRTPANIEAVGVALIRSPSKSTRSTSAELGISRRSPQRILHSDLHLFPYKITVTHKPTAIDKERRLPERHEGGKLWPPHSPDINPLKPELIPICYLLALLAHHFLHVSRIRVKSLTIRLLMSYIYGAPILDVSRSHTTTQHSR